jgi:hypothetical protein
MELFSEADPDFDAQGKAPKSKRKKVVEEAPPGVWDNCAKGVHRLCATEVIVNGTLEVIRCCCACHT